MPPRASRLRLLILGGTWEARGLAECCASDPRIDLLSSLAGRTRDPRRPIGAVRVGGFGGPAGQLAFLRATQTDAVVDATHPFAAQITEHAISACKAAGIPLLRLDRPAWTEVPGDRWVPALHDGEAASLLPALGERVLLTTGLRSVRFYSSLRGHFFLVRLVDPPATPLPLARHEVLVARGPFAVTEERALLSSRRIDVLVAKNSGGEATYAKIAAARERRLPVVLISRPPLPATEQVATVEAAWEWIQAQLR